MNKLHYGKNITAGLDYGTIAMVMEFQPGETDKMITVNIIDDRRTERNETFQLYLTAGQDVQLTPFSRTEITIQDDDGMYICIS